MDKNEVIRQKADGIFVDIEGTLIIADHLNRGLYETMILLRQTGEKVVILAGGPLNVSKEKLQENGVDINRFPVETKAKYRDCLFTGYVIDDCSPTSQRFVMKNPENYLKPYDAENANEFIEYISLTHKGAWHEKLEKMKEVMEGRKKSEKSTVKVANHKGCILKRLFNKLHLGDEGR